jgi:opacity protein-like surface antigen
MSNIKKFLVAMAAFSMSALPAMADDGAHNWSGFYIGGNFGSSNMTTNTFNTKPPLGALDHAASPTSLEPAGTRTLLPALQHPVRSRPTNP